MVSSRVADNALTDDKRQALILGEDVQRVLPLVVQRVLKRAPRHVEYDDLYGAAVVGLCQAARRWNAETGRRRGATFATYARWRMVGAMRDYMRQCDMLPRRERRKVQAGTSTHGIDQLEERHARIPDAALHPAFRPADESDEARYAVLEALLPWMELPCDVARARSVLQRHTAVLSWLVRSPSLLSLARGRAMTWRTIQQIYQCLQCTRPCTTSAGVAGQATTGATATDT